MKSPFNTVIIIGTVVFCHRDALSAVTKTTLTTAKVSKSSSSPKPNSLYQSLYRQINVEVTSNASMDLFHFRAESERNDMDAIWKWDWWCHLQHKVGDCSNTKRQKRQESQTGGPRQSYYYDSQLDKCSTFNFSGCDGNKNNFQTLEACERNCKGSSFLINDTKRPLYCELQPNVGLCLDLIERYYYDINTDECKIFVYGGCAGNQNRFMTEQLCNERCKDKYKYLKL